MRKKKIVAVVSVAVVVMVVAFTLYAISGGFADLHVLDEPKDGQIRVACVGDSITYGSLVFDHAHNNYPAQLGDMLGKGYVVNNYGYSGRAAHADTDMPYVNEELYQKSLAFAPDVVVVMLGTNDTRTGNWHGINAYIRAYGAILDSYLALPSHPQVIVMAPPPAFEFFGKVRYHINKMLVKNEVNVAVRFLAEGKNLPFIDLYEVFDGRKNLFVDGIHPNVKGASVLAGTVYNMIKNIEKGAESIQSVS